MEFDTAILESEQRLIAFAGKDVVYVRGGYNCDWRAIGGKTDFEQTDANGVAVSFQSADFIGLAAELVDEVGTVLTPERGDRIYYYKSENTYIYEVLNLRDAPSYRYSDPDRSVIRVHTKLIQTLAPLPPSPSPSPEPSLSLSPSGSPSLSISPSASPSLSMSPSPSPSASPSLSLSPSPSISLSLSPSISPSASPEPPSPSPSPSLFPTIITRGTFTCAAGATTTISDANVTATSKIAWLKNDNNQNEWASCLKSRSAGSFTIYHNNAAGNESQQYIVLNGTSNHIKSGSGNLNAYATTTVVNDANAATGSVIILIPLSIGVGDGNNYNCYARYPKVTTKANGSFTITHTSTAGTEPFEYIIFNLINEDNIYTGSGTLTAGTTTVFYNSHVQTSPASTILLQITNTAGNWPYWRITSRSNGTSFTITTNSVAGTETFDFVILNT